MQKLSQYLIKGIFSPFCFIFLVRTLLSFITNVDPKLEFPLFSLKHICVGKTYTYHPSRTGVLTEAGRSRGRSAGWISRIWCSTDEDFIYIKLTGCHVYSLCNIFLMVNCHSVNSFPSCLIERCRVLKCQKSSLM